MKALLAVLGGLLLLSTADAQAKDLPLYESGKMQVSFIELYTSDARASCGPALQWMADLRFKDPLALWKQWVPVMFPVDLWDAPGYKDVFSKPEYRERLLRYKKKWSSRFVYAPTVVVNGTEWSGWSKGQAIPRSVPKEVGVLKADGTQSEGQFIVEFRPTKLVPSEGLVLNAALVAFGLRSKPSDGENRGRVLSHDFIVLSYSQQTFKMSYGALKTPSFELKPKKGMKKQEYAVVFWVTAQDELQSIQATGGILPEL